MGVILGNDGSNKFNYIEYQVLMLCLTGVICTTLFFAEIALNRFQVLPLLFPGMFTVRDRRFYFFSFDISDGTIGKRVRSEAKKTVRLSIFLVLSYLWQHCVLKTTQLVGTEFPKKECDEGADCFSSDLHFSTLFTRQNEPVNCGVEQDFEKRVVVSCIRFVTPTATNWLMHLAIAHSVVQLNFKAFEMLVWVGGNSKWCQRAIGLMILVSFVGFVSLFFSGVLSEFVSSWLSFVMSLNIPLFLYCAHANCKNLEKLWADDAKKVQKQIEDHLGGAFAEIENAINVEAVDREEVKSHLADDAPETCFEAKHKRSAKPMQVMSTLKNAITRAASARGKITGKTPEDTERLRKSED